MNELYEKVKVEMAKKRISTNDLIEMTGLKQSTIYHIMKNEENFYNAKLANIISILEAINGQEKEIKLNENLKFNYDSLTENISFSLQNVNSQDFEMLIKLVNEFSSKKQQAKLDNNDDTQPKQWQIEQTQKDTE